MSLSNRVDVAGFDALPSQVAMLDPTGRIVFTNRAWREFSVSNGGGDRDYVGENYFDACERSGDDGAIRVVAAIRSLFDGDSEVATVEYPCHAPDEERWFTMRAKCFRHAGEEYVLVMHLDITERKQAELGLREQNERLETVASVLGHDLRNPLTVALGHAEMVDSDAADAVVESLERMETIVSDALVLARHDEANETRPVDLATRAERAWDHVETPDTRLTVADSATFDADPDLLGHVFENLFRNAVEHGGETVTVGARGDESPSARRRRWDGEDDGPGIPDDERDRVFDEGYSTESGNTGLGLLIVEKVVRAHGWRVAATEGTDGGARFEVRF
ncbi:PAS domain-containing sensor histidine kinase [Halorussus amylolyticus]|uniref:PAS domain-containing sensor histidine kinase n=1 Tax=Halorussus amylolyticus TaxID=1126242 RepID=UPI00138F6B93|nr:ATP-binding protein [Halorussus amylolyticus]